MSETKHTPGPWAWSDCMEEVIPGEGALMELVAYGPQEGDYQSITTLFRLGDRYEQSPSPENARLIAAAPDLLAALRKLANESQGFLAMAIREAHGNKNIQVLSLRIKESFDAIDKAEGRS